MRDPANQGDACCGCAHTESSKLVVGESRKDASGFQGGTSTCVRSHLTATGGRRDSNERFAERRSSNPSQSCRYFLYYRVKDGRVEVLARWHSSRLKDPKLKEPPNTPLQSAAEKRGG
jgi:hypothetical protein